MKIALLGYGKMGKTIDQLAQRKGHSVVYTLTSGKENGTFDEADVAIEFSSPEAAVQNIGRCLNAGIPVVSGTTGWLDRWADIIKICEARNGSFIYASNFSVGVNLFFNLNAYLAQLMAPYKEYLVSMKEVHHTEKKDAPSGTAISLANDIVKARSLTGWELDSTSKGKLPIEAVRKGDIKGTHKISYASDVDSISIVHKAHSREGFAAGALLAAEWLLDKKGVFSMKDVLNLS